jgi:soluble lytic murein transglycosylase-like protein
MGCDMMPCPAEEVNIDAVIEIESGGNPNAYNKGSGAIGLMQITPICYKDYHERAMRVVMPGCEVLSFYRLEDLWNPVINKNIGTTYINTYIPQMLRAYKIPDTIDNRLISYNAGIKVCKDYHRGKIKRLPRETREYLVKYHKLTKED